MEISLRKAIELGIIENSVVLVNKPKNLSYVVEVKTCMPTGKLHDEKIRVGFQIREKLNLDAGDLIFVQKHVDIGPIKG